MRFLSGAAAAGAAAAATAGYSLLEARLLRLTARTLELDRPIPTLSILHVSDTHLRAGNRHVAKFVEGLPRALGEAPDLVIVTGDIIEDSSGIDPAISALSRLEARLGRFYVLGSHDYFESRWQPPTKYFTRNKKPVGAPVADTPRLEEGLRSSGWASLTNTSTVVSTSEDGRQVRLTGVDDPYIGRHSTRHLKRSPQDAVAIGVTHAPDVVSEYVLAGYDLVLAGHTHGGQIRLPFVGALITNSALPTGLAAGAHRVGSAWLHVSIGLGTSRFTPIRLGARPEATLLRLQGT